MNEDFVIESGQKFISNVLGGAGAVWGSSEIVCLRNNSSRNRMLWRGVSGTVGVFFLSVYLRERSEKYNEIKNRYKIK